MSAFIVNWCNYLQLAFLFLVMLGGTIGLCVVFYFILSFIVYASCALAETIKDWWREY